MRQGRAPCAVLGVNQQETQSSVDAALTFATPAGIPKTIACWWKG